MISILIPTYNYNCYQLVAELQQQALSLNIDFEVIVADDASREEMKIVNRKMNKLSGCRYIELKQNIGRACIRNYLAEASQFNLLLFIDSDAGIKSKDFLEKYLKTAKEDRVICGGLLHPHSKPSDDVSLRYTYEKVADKYRMASIRQQCPYDKFTTFSFLIPRVLFFNIKFDSTFTKYGHEDTLFGYELQKKNIPIFHIDNPLYHLGLENNLTFLKKTETSIRNLHFEKNKLKEHSRLYTLYSGLCGKGLRIPLLVTYKFTYSLLKKNLLGKHPNMKLFALYKLGYLCALENRNKKAQL